MCLICWCATGFCACTTSVHALYESALASLISNFGFDYHFYADDVQFYITFNNINAFDASVIANCLKAVKQWLALKKIKLNPNKTQYM